MLILHPALSVESTGFAADYFKKYNVVTQSAGDSNGATSCMRNGFLLLEYVGALGAGLLWS